MKHMLYLVVTSTLAATSAKADIAALCNDAMGTCIVHKTQSLGSFENPIRDNYPEESAWIFARRNVLRGWQLASRLVDAMGASAGDQAELWPMTTKRASSGTAVYRDRIRQPIGRTHRADSGDPPGIVSPSYRGFRLACLAAQIPALQRAVDDHWTARYAAEETPAGRVRVLMEERVMRNEPKDWI